MDLIPPTTTTVTEGVPESDDDDVCAELADIFGEQKEFSDDEGVAGSDVEAPLEKELEPEPEQTSGPGILERLLAKKDSNMNDSIAGIVRDARSQINAPAPDKQARSTGMSLGEVTRKRRRRVGEGVSENVAKKRSKDTFEVLGRRESVKAEKHAFADTRFTGMRLRDCAYAESGLAGLFEHFSVINIADVADKACELRAGQIRDALIFGALVKKVAKKTSKNGARYAVFTLANMPLQRGKRVPVLTAINLLLFDTAFERHHMTPEGTVFALRNPSVLAPREEKKKRGHSELSGHCLSVRKAESVVVLAHATDYAQCDVENRGGARCGMWYHKGISSRCHYHTKQLLKRHTSSARAVINNAEVPGASKALFRPAKAPVNLSDQSAAMAAHVDRYGNITRGFDDVQKARNRIDSNKAARIGQTLEQIMRTKAKPKISNRATIAKHRSFARPKNLSRGASSKQRDLERARDVLTSLGFVLRRDGGLDPPSALKCKELGVTVRTDGLKSVPLKGPPRSGGDGDALLVKSKEMAERNPKRKEEIIVPPVKKLKSKGGGQARERVDNGRRQMEAILGGPQKKIEKATAKSVGKTLVEAVKMRDDKKETPEVKKFDVIVNNLMADVNNQGNSIAVPSTMSELVAHGADGENGDIELSDSSDEE